MMVIFASGDGSNFQAIADAFPTHPKILICNIENAHVIKRAQNFNIPYYVIPHKLYSSRKEHEKKIVNLLKQIPKINLIVLAGYMRVLSPFFFIELKKLNFIPQIINLHPANINVYKGARAFEYAVQNKFKHWGITVHEVIEEIDSGQILNYEEFSIDPNWNESELKKFVQPKEHKILTETIEKILARELPNT